MPCSPTRRLDPASSRVVARFALSLGWLGLIASAPALAGFTGPAKAVATLGTYCSFAALLRVCVAARTGEKPCARSLNNWDESLALVAASVLAYLAGRLLG